MSRGKVHNYLGMVLDYSTPGEVKVNMIKYIKDTVEGFIELVSDGAATPAAYHLFDVDADGVKLVEQLARVFHTTTAKLIFSVQTGTSGHPGTNSFPDHQSKGDG